MFSTTESEILDIIAVETVTRKENFTRDATIDQLGLDSVSLISIGYELEDKFGIAVDAEIFVGARTLGDVLDKISPLIAARSH
jgi:acyl carrier protein